MKSTMILTFAGAVVAAAGALATIGAESAVAGRTTSPFAGEYSGPRPGGSDQYVWGSISISSDGRIVGTQAPAGFSDDRFTGSVNDDGTYQVSWGNWNPNKARWWVKDARPSRAETDLAEGTIRLGTSGTLVLGSDGNLYGTATYGDPFVWRRK